MDTEAIRLAQAQWILGILNPDRLVEFACQALEADVDTPTLRLIAGEMQPTRATLQPLFERMLSELGIDPLDETQARFIVAQNWAKQIISGAVTPYDGAKAIWTECCDPFKTEKRLHVFLSLASEHEDFLFVHSGSPEHYNDLIRRCEAQIVQEAQRLLQETSV